ncbi:MAG: glycosyltransferase family 4 protein [Myxococcales bacterium]|nr:glycosyltransferase family 4 protein [Myxococcales bacterium]
MKVVAFTKYDRLAASARVRFENYIPYLAKEDIQLCLVPLLGESYLTRIFGEEPPSVLSVAKAYLTRFFSLLSAHQWDLVMIQYELFPYLPAWAEQWMKITNTPYVVDYDDAIFHCYDQHNSPVIRRLLQNKIAQVMSGAETVIVGNRYLSNYAKQYNPRVRLIPSVVDHDRYQFSSSKDSGPLTIGWIGSPSAFSSFPLVVPALELLGRESATRLVTVGAPIIELEHVEVETRPWKEVREAQDLADMDIGLMPLSNQFFNRGKCAFKLVQYMASGLPTVSSPVGANCEVVDGESGFFAKTTEEWLNALRKLRDSPQLRQQMGEAGRRRVVERFSVASQAARLASILREAHQRGASQALHGTYGRP